MIRFPLALLPFALLAAGPSASDVAKQIREMTLDPGACYRVRDLNFAKEDIRVYFTEGYLIFAKPIEGVPVAAYFTSDVDAGDAEVILLPARRSERMSLATFTNSPNLDEHFHSALLVFTDSTSADLLKELNKDGADHKAPDMGQMLSEKWTPVARNLSASFEERVVTDLLSPDRAAKGIFFMAAAGKTLGSFDVIYDPMAREQITAGQMISREGRSRFTIWTSFSARSFRTGERKMADWPFELSDIRIDASLGSNLSLTAVTKATIQARGETRRAFPFQISHDMRVTEAFIDGAPVEVFSHESLREAAIRGGDSQTFLVVAPSGLTPGTKHEIEFHHNGSVVTPAGNGVYFVGSRSTWYPRGGPEFATYDVTFHYPKALSLVATGSVVEDIMNGDTRTTRRCTDTPVRLAGFNLGDYREVNVQKPGYAITVCGNRRIEPALQQKPRSATPPLPSIPAQGRPRHVAESGSAESTQAPFSTPDPGSRLHTLANEVSAAFDFMTAQFGPAALNTLTVSPIPGTFGQGFPGLVYLSTISYLDPADRPQGVRDKVQQTFYSDILLAHETAHQWWGNVVSAESYEDEWLMEAIANYTALLYLEHRKGPKAIEPVLENYRKELLATNGAGKTMESAGPIIWGVRLQSSDPEAWRRIVYEKGTWIIHMLRRRMGDERFQKMLAEACKRYRYQTITTEQFHALAKEFMPPGSSDASLDTFFDNWVYGTGIPSLKLNYSIQGKIPAVEVKGTVTQTEVDEDFSADVPVEFQEGKGVTVQWVRSSSDPTPFRAKAKQTPSKVSIATGDILMRK